MKQQIALNVDCMEYMRTLPDKAFDLAMSDDGLRQNWGGETVFCNPPYGSKETGLWTEKCCREGQKPGTTVVLLIPARTDRASFHDYILARRNDMTRDEIVTALRCCEQHKKCEGACPLIAEFGCIEKAMGYAADLIENQQRHIEALLQANAALRDTVLRRDAQIEKMSAELADARNEIKKFYNGYDQLDASNSRLMAANEKLATDRKALKNELCQYCGKYKKAHKGSCDGCKWGEK